MLYENYRGKIIKVKEMLQTVWRFRILIFSLLAFALVSLGTFFGVYGMVYEVTPNIETLSYGQEIGYSANAVFGSVRYEYALQGSDEWSEIQPVRAGSYKVRAVSRNIFGGNRYGKEYAFVISPKQIDVVIDVESFVYGEMPQVSAPLEYGDTLTCTQFSYEDITSPYTKVVAEEKSVRIYDASGEDVTYCYSIRPVARLISFVKREISVVVQDKSGIYDGTPLRFDGYELDESTPLAAGDSIVAVFEDTITEVGETENLPSIKVLHREEGETFDVTVNYSIKITAGKLTVEKRPLRISTPDGEKVYDASPLSLAEGYTLAEECSLVEGHSLCVVEAPSITQAGSAENILLFAVLDEDGRDVTKNYSVFLDVGTLTVTPRPVTIETATNTWLYDGTVHSDGAHWVAEESEYELAEGHTSKSSDLSEITDVGSASNEMSIAISDAEGRDVTANYEITLINGTLTVTSRPVTIETATNTWVYDGTAHSDGEYWVAEESEYELAQGHTSKSSDLSEITDVGTLANEMSIAISDAEGRDVTANYAITFINGTLTVTPRPVTIETATNTWVYDGTAHSDGEHWVAEESEYELAEGHTSKSSDLSEITDVGTLANEMSIAISDSEGRDVTANYAITFINGTLTVTPRPVTIETATNTWVYDGTAHSDGEHWVAEESEYELVAGHTSQSSNLSEITNAGSIANEMSIAISDAEGRDVTKNYKITFINGTLTVTPRPVTIETATNTWVYDGMAHSDGEHWVAEESEYELAEGHTSASFDLSEITDVGTLDNEMSISISDAEGRDVTANYEITLINGTLTVIPRPVTIETATNTWVYDGTAHSDGTHWVAEESEYELAKGHTSSSFDLSEITDVGSTSNEMSIAISDSEGRDVTANYEITFINGTLTVTPRPVTIETATNAWVYDGTAHSDGEHWVAEESEYELVAGHTSKSSDLSEITDAGSLANEMSIAIFDAEGKDVTKNYEITFINGTLTVIPRPVTIETATNTWVYDGTAHSDGTHWVAEESEYELAKGHTSSSFDLSEITDVGSTSNEMSIAISDAEDRDVTANYAITFINGTLTVTPRPITVTANSDEKEYDGTPLICDKFTVTSELEWALVSWHEIEAEVVGSQTDVGESANKVVAVHIYDGEEEKTDNYAITTADGKLYVYARSITVIAGSAKKVYDGTELTCNLYRLFKSEGEALVLDHKEKVVIAGSQTEVGESSNVVVSVQIYSADKEVTSNYAITCEDGTLLVTPRPVTIETATNTWLYDGTAHSDGTHWVAEESEYELVAGHTSKSSDLSEITDVGSIANEMSIAISDAEGRDVTKNYKITFINGNLTVTPRPVTIETATNTWVYDGTAHSDGEHWVAEESEYELVAGHTSKSSDLSEITDVGSTSNEMSIAISDAEGRDVTANYAITFINGTLTVTPRPVTIETATNAWVYDGTAHSDGEHWVAEESEYELVAGHTSKSSDLSEITDVGSTSNEISISISDAESRDVTANYEITFINGTLTVTSRPVTIETATNTWVYDGTAHSDGTHWVAEESEYELAKGHTSSSFDLSEITDVGSTSNEMSIAISDSEGRDVTANYEITFINGTLTVTPRPVTIETATNAWVYDGTAHSDGEHWVAEESEYELVAGHTSKSSDLSEITDAGSLANEMSIAISDTEGRDVTANYEITLINGTLTVIPRPVTIETATNTWVYDGTAHSDGTHWVAEESEYELAKGHTSSSFDLSEITDVGSIANEMSIAISDAEGRDVTKNYEITFTNGTLTVIPRPVTIETATNTWVYDGTAHSDGEHWVAEESEYELVAGHTSKSSDLSEITDAGSLANEMSIAIFDAEGKDVTKNYEITFINGTLTVIPRPVTIETATNTWVYDGTAHSDGEHWVAEESEYELVAGHTSTSFDLSEITDAGSIANEMSIAISDVEDRDVTKNYKITFIKGTLTVTPRPITVTANSDEKEYDGTPLICDKFTVTSELEWALVSWHEIEAEVVGSQTDVGESANKVVAVHIYDGEEEKTGNYAITTADGKLCVYARSITVIAGSAKKVYDGTELTCNLYRLFKSEGEALVLDHKEKVVIAGSQTEAGESSNVVVSVQIYSADKEVTSNYAITCEEGTLLVTPRPVTIETATNTWVYDGTAHSDGTHWVAEESEYELVAGHTSKSSDLSEITDVGTLANEMSIAISDAEGRDVTANYEITLINGTLTVTPRPVMIETATNTWVYDGTAHSDGEHWVAEESEYELVAGHTSQSSDLSEITNAGSIANEMSIAISDAEDRDVTKNYKITFINGNLTVTPRPITVTANSDEKEYDGTPLICDKFTVTSELEWALVSWHEIEAEVVGSQTEIGESANKVASVHIYDGERDVTDNYSITCVSGTLRVIPRPVLFTTASANWLYDGTAHSDGDHWVSEASICNLLEGHRSVSSQWAQIREIGSTENTMVITILDADGSDVTKYYNVMYDCGTLRVVFAKVFVCTESAEKVYDGTELTCNEYSLETEFAPGYESAVIEVTCTGAITNAGDVENTFTIRVLWEGTDRKKDVEVTFELGILSILPRPVTITTQSGEWEYDGKEHSLPGVEVSAGEYDGNTYEILPGHTYSDTDYASITNPGQEENSCTFLIFDASSNDVTDNYEIIADFGTLTVLGGGGGGGGSGEGGQEGEEGGGGGGGNGDLDTSGNIGGGGGSGGDSVVAVRVLSDADGSIYLRLTSYGDLNNAETKWEAAVPYENLLDGKYSYNYLSGIALENAGYPRLDVSVDVIGTCYYLPYYMATGEDDYLIQQSDVLYEGSTDQVYSLNYFLYDITLDGTIGDTLGQYAEEELAYRNWVKGHYMQLDLSAQLREYFDRVIEQNGWREEKDTALLIAEVASFIQGAATYNLQYDTALDSSTDIVYDFLQVYEEGICQHYATAATVLLRYLGIPARYTIGYVGSTSAGEWTEITTANAHAWVEAYVEGFGWVQVEVTGGGPGGGGGGGGGSGEKLVLKPADAWKQYDGKELVATKVEGADTESKLMLYDYLARGYTYQAVFSGSQTEVGTGKSEIVSFVLYDPSGKKVQDISRVFLPGNLTVVENTLVTICPYSLQKVYDGKPLAYGANDYYVRGLPQGWRVEYSLEGVELADAGVIGYKNFSKKTLKVYGADGSLLTEGEDYFAVFDTDSALVVTKRKITLSSASASKEYDGLPLVKDSVWISSGALADGQVLTANAVGKIVDIGKVENKIKNIVISDENGANVGRNYVVTLSNGWLIVV